ncbi:MAG: TetR/AcrR family transcriptional regulator [Oscillospiraceae bacterium]|jgi:AcrR family transcriptional regulator
MQEKKEDLRVVKTQRAIKEAFKELVMEKNSSRITVKELAERAQIHRKTFYLHYTTIEALFEDVMRETAEQYYSEIDRLPPDASFSEVNRVFFEFMAKQEPYIEKMVCDPFYRDFSDKLFMSTMIHNRSRYNPYASYSKEEQSIINNFLCVTSVNIYRQWVSDGKKLPLGDLIELTDKLFVKGISSVRNNSKRI